MGSTPKSAFGRGTSDHVCRHGSAVTGRELLSTLYTENARKVTCLPRFALGFRSSGKSPTDCETVKCLAVSLVLRSTLTKCIVTCTRHFESTCRSGVCGSWPVQARRSAPVCFQWTGNAGRAYHRGMQVSPFCHFAQITIGRPMRGLRVVWRFPQAF